MIMDGVFQGIFGWVIFFQGIYRFSGFGKGGKWPPLCMGKSWEKE